MKGIRTAIQIIDGFTPTFKKLNTSLSVVSGKLSNAQRQFAKPINVSPIVGAKLKLAELADKISYAGNRAISASRQQREFSHAMNGGETAASGLIGKLKGVAAAYATVESVKAGISAADTYASTTSRLDLMKDAKTSVQELEGMIRKSADATFSSFKVTADAVAKMGIQAGEAFSSNEETVRFVEQLNKHMKIAGTSGAAAEGAMLQLTQAMANGVLRGEELNSVLDGMPTVAKTIEKHFRSAGYALPLKEIAEQGLITSDIVKDALFGVADETDAKFSKMKTTFGDLWAVFTNRADEALKPFYEQLTSISNNASMRTFVESLGSAVGTLASALGGVMTAVSTVFAFARENAEILAPIVGIVAAGFAAWGAAALFAAAKTAWLAVVSAAETVALLALEFATNGVTAGFIALGGAMGVTLSPLMATTLAVTTLVGLFYFAVAMVNKFAGTSISATGAIAGAFAWVGAAIANVFIGVLNVFARVAEFFSNVFKNPIYSVLRLFVQLDLGVLKIVRSLTNSWDGFATSFANGIVSALNWVIGKWNAFLDLLPDTVTTKLGMEKGQEFEKFDSVTAHFDEQIKIREQALNDYKPADYQENGSIKYFDLKDSFGKGYDWGEGIADSTTAWASDLMSSVSKVSADANAQADAKAVTAGKLSPDEFKKKYPEIAKKLDKLVGNTNSLNSIPEDLEFMRSVGERESINRFTTAEIKVNTTNNNSITNGMDIDSMIDAFTEKLRNAMTVAAEGSHV